MIEKARLEIERLYAPAVNAKAPYAKIMSKAAAQAAFRVFVEELLAFEDTQIPMECINMDDPEGYRMFRGLVRVFARKEQK